MKCNDFVYFFPVNKELFAISLSQMGTLQTLLIVN